MIRLKKPIFGCDNKSSGTLLDFSIHQITCQSIDSIGFQFYKVKELAEFNYEGFHLEDTKIRKDIS